MFKTIVVTKATLCFIRYPETDFPWILRVPRIAWNNLRILQRNWKFGKSTFLLLLLLFSQSDQYRIMGCQFSVFRCFFLWPNDPSMQLKQSRFFHAFGIHWKASWKIKLKKKKYILLLNYIFHHSLLCLWTPVTRENQIQPM